MPKGKCVICGKETSNYHAQTAPLNGSRLVLRNENQEIIAETSKIITIPPTDVEMLILFVCEDHNYWKSYEISGNLVRIPMNAQQSAHLTKSRWAQFWDKLSAAFRR